MASLRQTSQSEHDAPAPVNPWLKFQQLDQHNKSAPVNSGVTFQPGQQSQNTQKPYSPQKNISMPQKTFNKPFIANKPLPKPNIILNQNNSHSLSSHNVPTPQFPVENDDDYVISDINENKPFIANKPLPKPNAPANQSRSHFTPHACLKEDNCKYEVPDPNENEPFVPNKPLPKPNIQKNQNKLNSLISQNIPTQDCHVESDENYEVPDPNDSKPPLTGRAFFEHLNNLTVKNSEKISTQPMQSGSNLEKRHSNTPPPVQRRTTPRSYGQHSLDSPHQSIETQRSFETHRPIETHRSFESHRQIATPRPIETHREIGNHQPIENRKSPLDNKPKRAEKTRLQCRSLPGHPTVHAQPTDDEYEVPPNHPSDANNNEENYEIFDDEVVEIETEENYDICDPVPPKPSPSLPTKPFTNKSSSRPVLPTPQTPSVPSVPKSSYRPPVPIPQKPTLPKPIPQRPTPPQTTQQQQQQDNGEENYNYIPTDDIVLFQNESTKQKAISIPPPDVYEPPDQIICKYLSSILYQGII